MRSPPCRYCGSIYHFPFQCAKNPKKKKPLKQKGRRTLIYEEWRDMVAVPYLDATYGRICAYNGCNESKNLDIDHIKKRGSHPHLKMELSNVQYMCRPHHRLITDKPIKEVT